MRILVCLLVVMLTLPSCAYVDDMASQPEKRASLNINYELYPSTALDVKRLEVTNSYVAPIGDGHVEYKLPIPIFSALHNMFRIKLLALGDKDVFKVNLEEASIIKEDLPIDVSVWGAFKKEPVARLKANVVVRLKLIADDAPNIVVSYADIKSERTKLLYESMTEEEVKKAYLALTQELIGDVNKGLRTTVRKYFSSVSF